MFSRVLFLVAIPEENTVPIYPMWLLNCDSVYIYIYKYHDANLVNVQFWTFMQ